MVITNNDSLGDRMKLYESQYAGQKLLPRIPVIARIDGRAFHTFCKGLKRPFDERLSNLMSQTTAFLVEETNANCGYTQSDEISLVWLPPDFKSDIFFKGKLLKMTSMLASMATAFFNKNLAQAIPEKKDRFAFFDARIWNVPLEVEVANYFTWREMDATRNSISMAAQSEFPHKKLQNKNSSQMQDMLWEKGINWNDYPSFFKRGVYVQKRKVQTKFETSEIEKLPKKHAARTNPDLLIERQKISFLEMPPILKVENRTNVLLYGEEPVLK